MTPQCVHTGAVTPQPDISGLPRLDAPPGETVRAYDVLLRDGIVAVPGALPRVWGAQLAEDFAVLFSEARSRPDGLVNRGTNRFYFTVHPERLRGFAAVAAQPMLSALSSAVLGPEWRLVEVAFDVPLPGSRYQPWHRDFASPTETHKERRLSSLAFNLTGADVTPEMGPFEIAPGTHWDDGSDFAHGMFPGDEACARYDTLAVPKMPRLGDMSVRSGLTLHRGTPNRSPAPRPVLILGVVGPEVTTGPHGLEITRGFARALPGEVRDRLDARVVDELHPLQQTHDIEGLVMGD